MVGGGSWPAILTEWPPSCCLAGRAYPRGELAVDQAPSVKRDVFHCITALRPLDDDQGDTFPYLRALLRFNTCEFLNVLALALEEPEFASTEAGLAQKQRLVDILLQVMVQGQGYSVRLFQSWGPTFTAVFGFEFKPLHSSLSHYPLSSGSSRNP